MVTFPPDNVLRISSNFFLSGLEPGTMNDIVLVLLSGGYIFTVVVECNLGTPRSYALTVSTNVSLSSSPSGN